MCDRRCTHVRKLRSCYLRVSPCSRCPTTRTLTTQPHGPRRHRARSSVRGSSRRDALSSASSSTAENSSNGGRTLTSSSKRRGGCSIRCHSGAMHIYHYSIRLSVSRMQAIWQRPRGLRIIASFRSTQFIGGQFSVSRWKADKILKLPNETCSGCRERLFPCHLNRLTSHVRRRNRIRSSKWTSGNDWLIGVNRNILGRRRFDNTQCVRRS